LGKGPKPAPTTDLRNVIGQAHARAPPGFRPVPDVKLILANNNCPRTSHFRPKSKSAPTNGVTILLVALTIAHIHNAVVE
jgi:hypothetical protein